MGLFGKLVNAGAEAVKEVVRKQQEGDDVEERAPEDLEAHAQKVADSIDADVRMFSGCMDCQTSADVKDVSKFGLPNGEGAGGACTNALLANLSDDREDSWLSLLKGMRETLQDNRFTQVPQLSTSRIIDVDGPFSLMNAESNGNTRALLIGINYIGQQGELAGCHNDVLMMVDYIGRAGFNTESESCLILMDDGSHAEPTRENIIKGFRWLVSGAEEGDSLFMHYSGHGAYTADTSGDEADNQDETMVPVDYMESGQITDDEILKELVCILPAGVTLTVLMDCCHSGSILDLPYALKADEGTIAAVEAGEAPALTENPNFDLMKILKVAKEVYTMFKAGDMDMSKLGKLAALAMS